MLIVKLIKNKWMIALFVCLICFLFFIFTYFEPHKLFIDEKSSEITKGEVFKPKSTGSDKDKKTVAQERSQWRSREHKTSGDVFLTKDGENIYVRLENLKTDNGPDLKVYIAKSVQSDGTPNEFIDLGDLKANIGDANYLVPRGVNIEDYNYVVIWCKRFSVSFADAEI